MSVKALTMPVVKEEKEDLTGIQVKEERDDMEDSYVGNSSSFLNESLESGGNLEEVLLFDETVELPPDLFTNQTLFHSVLSLDTWENCISEDIKQRVMSLLPNFPKDDVEEKMNCLKMLFGGENIAFGNPISDFRNRVLNGDFSPDRRRLTQCVRSAKKEETKLEMENYQFRLMNEILKSRKKLLEATSGGSMSVPLAVQKIEKQSIKPGKRMKIRSKHRYLEEMKRLKAELGEEGLSSDDEEILKFCQENETDLQLIPEFSPSKGSLKPVPMDQTPTSASLNNLDEEKMRSSLTQESQPSYFNLINDLFLLGKNYRLTVPELDQAMSVWQESPIAALNSWYSLCADPRGWRSCIPSAIAFLCGSFPDQVPPNFHPFVYVDESLGCYQWIGEGREASLSTLFDWWWERKDSCKAGLFTPKQQQLQLGSPATLGEDLLNPGVQTSWKVRPSTLQERLEYQRQEGKRYSDPTKPYRWVMQDYSVCVAPVKGALAVKVKNHPMLRPNRPPYVTVLTLVRDAVSRLPNGEGSRSDILELLKDSQFLNQNVDPAGLNTTVSGALDRLQNEVDACVKYDSNRKIWIYLHRDKTMEELENMQTNTKPKPRSKKKLKMDSGSPAQDSRPVLSSPLMGVAIDQTLTTGSLKNILPQRAFTTSTPKRISGLEANSVEESSEQLGQPVQRIIVRGADGQILPLSPGTLQQLIDSGAVQTGTTVVDESGV